MMSLKMWRKKNTTKIISELEQPGERSDKIAPRVARCCRCVIAKNKPSV